MQKVFFVTASIACGKSSFMQIAKDKGYKTASADEIAHKLLNEKKDEIYELFKKELSKDELIKNGQIDRKILGKIVFNNKNKLKKLENFLHPKIKDEILKFIKENEKDTVFIELPLFFESQRYQNLGYSLLIYAPKEVILNRLMKRDKINKDEAIKRISLQMDIEKKREKADFVIDNSSDLKNFKEACDLFFKELENESL
ncbi:dephospho-CoA kinase [uncultured Campylobacter sp.]|uniref:dephospho-CoA kinase n=1 Tax=uncultured Campylobacter sp. TaxID=218934 RepID=UPI002636AD36|nr:dephospho-CoA kinase [uncultured Campylobacter sp.]